MIIPLTSNRLAHNIAQRLRKARRKPNITAAFVFLNGFGNKVQKPISKTVSEALCVVNIKPMLVSRANIPSHQPSNHS
jgi:hypothetical protein